MSLNTHQLRLFYAASRSESNTGAASDLMVTPVAITSQVKLMEENAGLKLRKHFVPF